MNWPQGINEAQLQSVLSWNLWKPLDDFATIDEMGYELALSAARRFGSHEQLWDRLKTEFRLLVCVSDTKYDALRKRVDSLAAHNTTALVAWLAAALGAAIGTAAITISPMVALLLLASLRLGKEAFCASVHLDRPLTNLPIN